MYVFTDVICQSTMSTVQVSGKIKCAFDAFTDKRDFLQTLFSDAPIHRILSCKHAAHSSPHTYM